MGTLPSNLDGAGAGDLSPPALCVLADIDEDDRLAILAEYDADSLKSDPELHGITEFAAQLCEAPIALVSLVEEERQSFVARHGLDASETPRSMSFCQHAMLQRKVFEVSDARNHPLFADNPLVTGQPHIRFYAGAPLVSDEGAPLGSLCVIDPRPRTHGLTDLQRDGLTVLARAVMRRLTERRQSRAADAALEESRDRFNALADAMPQMAWSTRADGKVDYFNRRWEEFTGVAEAEHHGDGWAEALHPDDLPLAVEAWTAAVQTGEPYEVEYRLRRHDGEYRWTLARGLPVKDGDGEVVRWFGTNTDIHERRMMADSLDLVSRELSHRIKNIFSLVSGLIGFEARGTPELKPLVATLGERLRALGRAHDYVRPQGAGESASRTLHGLLGELFAAYVDEGRSRVRVSGEDMDVGDGAVTPLALLFHELATNAVKYGALSEGEGTIDLVIARDGDTTRFEWREEGGPERRDEGPSPGFGHGLIDTSVTRQLKGTIDRGWDKGFTATIRVPTERLTR